MKLLIVDSDRDLVEMLTGWLRTIGHEIYRAYSIERARSEWIEKLPDLVIIDTSLKGALTMCRELKFKHDALVVVLTDSKDVHDEVLSLDSGADDYLHKPFFPSQLLAHIRAVSRRTRSSLEQRPSSVISIGPICVDSMRNEVSVYGRRSRLTSTESKLLHLLAINVNNVCTAEQIVTHVWGYDGSGDVSLIKAHVLHLRQKIEENPARPQYIITVPSVGYTLVRPGIEGQDIYITPKNLNTEDGGNKIYSKYDENAVHWRFQGQNQVRTS